MSKELAEKLEDFLRQEPEADAFVLRKSDVLEAIAALRSEPVSGQLSATNADIDELLRLAKTAALIEKHKMGVDFMTGNWIVGKDRKVSCYPTIHEAVRAVADKIKRWENEH